MNYKKQDDGFMNFTSLRLCVTKALIIILLSLVTTDKSFVPAVEFFNGKCAFVATIPDENNLGYTYIVTLDTHGIIDVLFETPYPYTETCGNLSDGLIFVSEFKSLGNELSNFFTKSTFFP